MIKKILDFIKNLFSKNKKDSADNNQNSKKSEKQSPDDIYPLW
tara:strand:- start:498 stop:626 length:129 start_codon:yes stop_codon:yes gene_type:complete